MINLYPANKMENLLALLNKISQVSPIGAFNQEVIIVQNPGMQHWLNLAIANERGISMNIRYALPAQYLWQLIRTLASEDKVPEQSPYSREVLTWRIYALLATETVINNDDFKLPTYYWLNQATSNTQPSSTSYSTLAMSGKADLKRYQLAVQMADLYEQYLIFRPEWLDAWQHGKEVISLSAENKWQAKLWQLLINELPYNPVELLNDAIANIADKLGSDSNILPKRMSFFGINTMAPMWLNFINALSEFIEVDFFHLNPCFSYWGDIINEKQAFKKLSHWSNGANNDEHLFVGNPLLANFGQQGREFLALLQGYSTVNIELFVKSSNDNSIQDESINDKLSPCILHQLQNDILELNDATEKDDTAKKSSQLIDDSITIVSCHSALREVQALHDYLLHQFNDTVHNKDKLTPKDVLVMCPQIEQYAPYVNAVFTRGWQDLADEVPPLPCSISDRSAKDSDPLIAAFSELLTLPDSRFQVSQLLSFIRLPAVANKFSINAEDTEKISLWLQQATIHWGLDQVHKESLLGEQASNSFTWQQGLSRLLQGFAYSDTDSVYQNQLLLGAVEGDDAILLGQLMLFIEQLQHFSHQLNSARTAKAWQSFLLNQLELLFATQLVFSTNTSKQGKSQVTHQINNQIENSTAIIEQAIASLVEYCEHAHFNEEIGLSIIIDFLNNHFSQGDTSRQFMVGQVTFCSMLPMRSIPFKVIAVLGLNDGEFPRQRPALSFDLIAQSKPVLGDRSRRGDDRYLFLEAIISARKALYLSYQGRNIRNNNEKQPSLVLKELMDYLAQGYGWHFDQANSNVHQMPMQPYSEDNYKTFNSNTAFKPSFDTNWLALGQNTCAEPAQMTLLVGEYDIAENVNNLTATDLIRFFQHPSKFFAQQVLNLYLDTNEVSLNDVEPFAVNYLDNYILKQDLLAASLLVRNSVTISQVIETASLSGKYPDLPSTQLHFDEALDASSQLAQEIIDQGCDNPELIDCQIVLQTKTSNGLEQSLTLMAQLPIKITKTGAQLIFYRSSSAKAKDLFTLYLHHLIMQVWQQQNNETAIDSINPLYSLGQVEQTRGFYFNAKAQNVEQYYITNDRAEEAKAELTLLLATYEQGQKQALMLNGDLAAEVFKESRGKRIELTQARLHLFWQGSDLPTGAILGFGSDPYIHFFWPEGPDFNALLPEIESVYQGMYSRIVKEKVSKKSVSKTSQSSVVTTEGVRR